MYSLNVPVPPAVERLAADIRDRIRKLREEFEFDTDDCVAPELDSEF